MVGQMQSLRVDSLCFGIAEVHAATDNLTDVICVPAEEEKSEEAPESKAITVFKEVQAVSWVELCTGSSLS